MTAAGFCEVQHTADWELEIWAPTLEGLFEQAALGMYTLAGVRLQPEIRQEQGFELSALDLESLLVKFLGELLFLGAQYNLAFDRLWLEIRLPGATGQECGLLARMSGAPILEQTKEIKAVTYHQLQIRQAARGMETRIVFDV